MENRIPRLPHEALDSERTLGQLQIRSTLVLKKGEFEVFENKCLHYSHRLISTNYKEHKYIKNKPPGKKASRNKNNRFRSQDFQLLEWLYTRCKITMCEMFFSKKFKNPKNKQVVRPSYMTRHICKGTEHKF